MTGLTQSFIFLALLGSALAAQAAPASPEALMFFENKVRPLLVKQCQQCHGETKHKGGLRLDNLSFILQGGDTGPAVVPGDIAKSLMVKAIEYGDKDLQMPPDDKMAEADIITLKQWITMGAPWPATEVAKGAKPAHRPGDITAEDRQWWAFQKVVEPALPAAPANAVLRNPIDSFVTAKLAQNGLHASPEASPTELIRRVTLDLTGLPPTPERVAQFVADSAAEATAAAAGKAPEKPAYERLVDELLASPRYGERWAQHWLDLVRYAESDGYRIDTYRPNAWPYRDYVIRAFNEDKPYGQFVREQIAGDEISPDDPTAFIGTGFLRHTIYEYNERDAEGQWGGILNEVTDVTGDVFLGLSMQCAHCHDHKFDPILQKDYYRLQAFFGNITWAEDKLLATPEEIHLHDEEMKAYEDATVEPRHVVDSILEPRIAKKQEFAMSIFPDAVKDMYKKPRDQRTPWEEQVVQLAWRQAELERAKFKEEKGDHGRLRSARQDLAKFDHLKPKPLLTAFVVGETGTVGATTKFKSRKAGEVEVKPGFLTILDPTDAVIPPPSGNATTTGRRTVLANWLTNPENPLTWRVMVNRVWQYHFGKGINGTASDFGHLGEKPSHPELLDWLTSGFIKTDGKLKDLQRLIVTSATYRQSARLDPKGDLAAAAMLKDPDNRLMWRYSPHRLDAEQARDSALAASGELKDRDGGEGEDRTSTCRSIYMKRMRNTPDSFLACLDQPPGFQSIPERQATTTATQSLLMINGDWPLERAHAMATRLLKSDADDDAGLVRNAYTLAFAREPNEDEIKAATGFLKTQRGLLNREEPAPTRITTALASTSKYFDSGASSKTSKTLVMQPGTANEKLRINLGDKIEPETFNVEAVVYLKSVYPDATVRPIVSRWNNKKEVAGWSFGITGQKSNFKSNTLIMQLSGEDFQGSPSYEVVSSGIHIETGHPYYVAASVDIHPGPNQQFGGNVTFYVRDLSKRNNPMMTINVADQIPGAYVNEAFPLYIGGRAEEKHGVWDGALARVTVRSGALDPANLMTWAANTDDTIIADITADKLPVMVQAAPATRWTWETSVVPVNTKKKGPGTSDPDKEAIADLCHALLNSNEFFYLQ